MYSILCTYEQFWENERTILIFHGEGLIFTPPFQKNKNLLPNFKTLEHELTISKKIEWLDEETRFLLDQELYEPSIEQICYKTKGLSRLDNKFQVKAIKLAAWREKNAQQKNKPRKWIMSDKKLLDYAVKKVSLQLVHKNFLITLLKNHLRLSLYLNC